MQNGLIIKYRYSPLFEGLIQEKVLFYKTSKPEKALEITADSEVIIDPKLGGYPVMLRIQELHKLMCYYYTIATICLMLRF